MSGSSVASLSGASIACPSTSNQASKPAKGQGSTGKEPAFPLRPAPMLRGLSIGFSPATTPDRSGLLGILGVGVGSTQEANLDDLEPAVEVTSDEKSETIQVASAQVDVEMTTYDDPIMIGRRIEDEWWANYVDFGDREPVSGMMGK